MRSTRASGGQLVAQDIYCLAGQCIETCFRARTNRCGTCESDHAVAQVSAWKAAGFHTVAVTGGFDLFTLNHVRGLVQARILAAAYLLGIEPGLPLGEAGVTTLLDLASSQQLKLLVSIDTNEAVKAAKGNNPSKGDAERPFLSWTTRAELVSSLAMPSDTGIARRLVDAVTAHGHGACPVHDRCLVQEDGYEVFQLGPDVTVMKDEYDAGNRPRRYDAANVVLFSERKGAFTDPVLGGVVSTTSLINRIKGV